MLVVHNPTIGTIGARSFIHLHHHLHGSNSEFWFRHLEEIFTMISIVIAEANSRSLRLVNKMGTENSLSPEMLDKVLRLYCSSTCWTSQHKDMVDDGRSNVG